ncbi:MAG: hypothetical protein EOO90_06445 [Pedobacter sp.]|nr:MAG: hypothetical protein EOO90_06445 [Pedobacter sp.]
MVPASKNRKIPVRTRQSPGSGSHSKKQNKNCTTAVSRADLLTMKLMPIVSTEHPELCKQREIEKEFFSSLAYLCDFYGLSVVRNKSMVFPINILAAFEEISAKLLDKNENLKLAIVQDHRYLATLATAKPFDTNMTLYYIPCEPLYLFLEDNSRKPLADLCLSVFTYLFQVAEVPHHRQSSSYLSQIYDTLEQWLIEEDEPLEAEYREAEIEELEENFNRGDHLLRQISDWEHLRCFEQRVASFQPSTKVEIDFLDTASKALALYLDFPDRSLMQNIHTELIAEDEDSNGRVRADKYMSFIWSFNDSVYDMLEDTINCDLQECINIDEPFAMQFFDCLPDTEVHDFDFEIRFLI